MGTCLEKLLKTTKTPVPEPILGKIALYVSVTVYFCYYYGDSGFYRQSVFWESGDYR